MLYPYVADILDQPRRLRSLLSKQPWTAVRPVSQRLNTEERIVLTGMGASLFALMPAWQLLVRLGRPAWLIETAQLLHDLPELVTSRTLVIAASQSGRSAEIVALADRRESLGTLIAVTNDGSSPLVERSDIVIGIESGDEHSVSTGSYVNTLAAATLAAELLSGHPSSQASLEQAAEALADHLETWRDRVETIKESVGLPERLYLLGRGASLAAADCGALIVKEAAKWPVEAMSSAQFRHGPLELADRRLTAIVFAGHNNLDRDRNLRLLKDIERYGGHGFVADVEPEKNVAALRIANAHGIGRAVAEIVAIQLVSIAIAEQTGIEPGVFRHLEKVTTIE